MTSASTRQPPARSAADAPGQHAPRDGDAPRPRACGDEPRAAAPATSRAARSLPYNPLDHHRPPAAIESPPRAPAAVSVRAAARAVRRRHAESGAARRSTCRSASRKHPTPQLILDALARGRQGPRELSHDGRRARAARGDRRVARAPARPRRARSGDAGAAGARQPRGAVRVRADGHRRAAAPAPRSSCPIRSTRSTKARRCSPAPSRIASTPMPARGFAPRGTSVPDDVWARTQLLYVCSPDNPTGRVTDARRMARAVRAVRPPRLRHRRRRVLFGDLFRRGAAAARRARRRAGAGPRRLSAARRRSAACRSARTRRACAPATSPATPR